MKCLYGTSFIHKNVTDIVTEYFVKENNIIIPQNTLFNNYFSDIIEGELKSLYIIVNDKTIIISEQDIQFNSFNINILNGETTFNIVKNINMNYRQIIEKDGYCIISNIYTESQIDIFKNEIIEYLNNTKNLYFDGNGISIPNFVDIPKLSRTTSIKNNNNIHKVLYNIFNGDNYRFCSHNDIGINRITDWHKDKLNDEVEKYETINIWSTHENQTHEIIKVLIYLQDHSKDNHGLKIVPGSHLKSNYDINGWIQLNPKLGDVIIFDQRITHRGMEHEVSNPRILVSFGFGKNNIFTDNFEKGTIERQTKQTKQTKQVNNIN
jgi:hypothetical protein